MTRFQVLGFREAMFNLNYIQSGSKYQNTPQIVAGVVAALFAAACALGPRVGFEPHSAFLLGVGNLPQDMVAGLPFGTFSYEHASCLFLRLLNSHIT